MKKPVSRETKRYYIVSLFLMGLSNRVFYGLPRLFTRGRFHWDLSLPLDGRIPVLPWTMLIYFGCILWWVYIYWLAARQERERADRFFCADLLAKIVCFVIFAAFPTTVARPALTGDSFWVRFLRFLYSIDEPENLFPSLHVVLGWLCWIAVRGRKDVPFTVRLFSLFMAIAVCVSTLTTRQHVLLDIPGGVAVAELCWQCCRLERLKSLYGKLADRLIVLCPVGCAPSGAVKSSSKV